MTESKTVEWASVNEALEDAVAGIFVGVTDNGWDATPIPTLEQDTIEIDIRVPYKAGWMPGEDENGVLICRKAMGEDFEINVGVEPLDLRVGLKNGFWLVRGVFSVQEID